MADQLAALIFVVAIAVPVFVIGYFGLKYEAQKYNKGGR